ncbi:unnamed protein product [Rhizophagus irregularis]|uniref:Uncharacterized protein n=1 Tax=Rhizophagus irregularis TaxID=588596 RepID=A0A916E1R7_9GLOM|nr:unnamed protein product [Rhizophagus irregularis]
MFLQERTERFFQNGDLEEGTVSFETASSVDFQEYKRYGKERSLLSRFQNGDFSGFLRMQEVAEGMVRSFRTVMIKNRGKWGVILNKLLLRKLTQEPSPGLEFVKEYWHSDLEFSCKGTCIRTWNSLAKRVG